MPNKFKSFEEFGQAAKQEQVQNLKQQIDDIFEKSDNFEIKQEESDSSIIEQTILDLISFYSEFGDI
mgnify:CR=1 FL=1